MVESMSYHAEIFSLFHQVLHLLKPPIACLNRNIVISATHCRGLKHFLKMADTQDANKEWCSLAEAIGNFHMKIAVLFSSDNDCLRPENRSYVLNLNLSKQNFKTIPPEIGRLNKVDSIAVNPPLWVVNIHS